MNKYTGLAASAIFAAVAMMISGCGNNRMKAERITANVQEALSPERSDSVTISMKVEYPVSGVPDNVRQAMCETISGAVFGTDYAGLELQAAADRWAADFVEEYRKTNLGMLHEMSAAGETEAADNLGMLNWESRTEGYFSGKYDNVLSYTVFSYEYMGGAHGSSSEIAINMDGRTGQQIRESDFFIPGYKEQLSKLLTARLHEAIEDEESYETLFIKDIEPNGNFKVSEQGVTFIYGQYEIGPYCLGIIRVTIPWNELGDLVREHPTE